MALYSGVLLRPLSDRPCIRELAEGCGCLCPADGEGDRVLLNDLDLERLLEGDCPLRLLGGGDEGFGEDER